MVNTLVWRQWWVLRSVVYPCSLRRKKLVSLAGLLYQEVCKLTTYFDLYFRISIITKKTLLFLSYRRYLAIIYRRFPVVLIFDVTSIRWSCLQVLHSETLSELQTRNGQAVRSRRKILAIMDGMSELSRLTARGSDLYEVSTITCIPIHI